MLDQILQLNGYSPKEGRKEISNLEEKQSDSQHKKTMLRLTPYIAVTFNGNKKTIEEWRKEYGKNPPLILFEKAINEFGKEYKEDIEQYFHNAD